MRKTKYSAYFVLLSVFTLVSLVIMVVQKGYSGLVNKDIQTKYNHLLNPINPGINADIVEEIEKKKVYLGNKKINISTESGQLSPTQTPENAAQQATPSSVINPN